MPDAVPETVPAWSSEDGARRVRAMYADRLGGAAGTSPLVTVAPGRVNLIGEHTDYNGGLCLPIALPHATYAASTPRTDGRFRMVSGESGEVWEGAADDLATASGWAAYAAGVVWALGQEGHGPTGLDLAVTGCVPLGAGLSSSAALECSVGLAVVSHLGLTDDGGLRRLLAQAGIRAENEVAGAATGGMDQTIAVEARADHALLLDCRSWETEQVPFDPPAVGLALLVIDTRVQHELNDGGYEARRRDCEEAATILGVDTLREATVDDLARIDDEQVRRRARHVVTEIARVAEAASSLKDADWARMGALMQESHTSMRDDFEISCPELDAVVETALEQGALGARMTGGGFGGSAIALVPVDRVEALEAAVATRFTQQGWRAPAYLPAYAGPAARVLS